MNSDSMSEHSTLHSYGNILDSNSIMSISGWSQLVVPGIRSRDTSRHIRQWCDHSWHHTTRHSGTTTTSLPFPPMYLRLPEGVYVHASEWPRYESRYSLPNLKKAKALKMWNLWVNMPVLKSGKPNKNYMPDRITCYKKERDWVKLPNWITWLYPSKFISTYDNQTIKHPSLLRQSYDYQAQAIWELLTRNVWLLHASTGSWKTQIICDITSRLSRKTLIVVQNLTQMQQMVDDIAIILWVVPIQISGKKSSKKAQALWYEGITVCSIDSRHTINPKEYWLILLDEADTYLGADERRNWIWNLSPEYMYALTGTVNVNDMDDSIFELYYWPKTRLEMIHLTPNYAQVLSTFRYQLDDIRDFHELKAALYSDTNRNQLILRTVQEAIRWSNRKGILFTEHIEHAKLLAESLTRLGITTFILIGEVSKERRESIRQQAKDSPWPVCIVGSVKIIWRWFDIPELSFAVLTTSEKFKSNIEQYIGRIVRKFEGKPQPIFYDIVDHMQPLLNNQSKSRASTFRKTFPSWKTFIK